MPEIDELLAETGSPVVVANDQGAILRINDCFEKSLGWSLPALEGKLLTVLMPKRLRDAHTLGFSRYLTTGKSTLLNMPLELAVVTADGTELPAEHFIIEGQWHGRRVFAAIIRPQTD